MHLHWASKANQTQSKRKIAKDFILPHPFNGQASKSNQTHFVRPRYYSMKGEHSSSFGILSLFRSFAQAGILILPPSPAWVTRGTGTIRSFVHFTSRMWGSLDTRPIGRGTRYLSFSWANPLDRVVDPPYHSQGQVPVGAPFISLQRCPPRPASMEGALYRLTGLPFEWTKRGPLKITPIQTLSFPFQDLLRVFHRNSKGPSTETGAHSGGRAIYLLYSTLRLPECPT